MKKHAPCISVLEYETVIHFLGSNQLIFKKIELMPKQKDFAN